MSNKRQRACEAKESPTGGTFTLTSEGETTAPIAHDAWNAASSVRLLDIQLAAAAIQSLGRPVTEEDLRDIGRAKREYKEMEPSRLRSLYPLWLLAKQLREPDA